MSQKESFTFDWGWPPIPKGTTMPVTNPHTLWQAIARVVRRLARFLRR